MAHLQNNWTLLVYKIPTQPSRLRLQIWRKLQRMGALYLQDAVCVVPSRPDLDENMLYIAEAISEMGGIYHLFKASAQLPDGEQRLIEGFRSLADSAFAEVSERLVAAQTHLCDAESLSDLEEAEATLKRERIAYLRAARLAYFGSSAHDPTEKQLDEFRCSLDDLNRTAK